MSSQTILLDFRVEPLHMVGNGALQIESEIVESLESKFGAGSVENIIRKDILAEGDQGGSLAVLTGPHGSTLTIRMYANGLITINIDYYLKDGETTLLTLEECASIEANLSSKRNIAKTVKTLPPIRRGIRHDVYFLSSDFRLFEYDIDKVLFDQKSDFQRIQILHSTSFGNLLVLDDLQNLAEGDIAYTEAIMCRGKVDYTGKDVLILGGGDGALLYELRKENAASITMVEIDDMVMKACKIHMRKVCGDTLDNYKTENYEIIVGDAIQYMLDCQTSGKTFDYIFGDLTDIPISSTPQGELWDFIKKILNSSFAVLKQGGTYLTHGNGCSAVASLKMYEEMLTQLDVPVVFTKTNAFVPSFMEDWIFYQIQRQV